MQPKQCVFQSSVCSVPTELPLEPSAFLSSFLLSLDFTTSLLHLLLFSSVSLATLPFLSFLSSVLSFARSEMAQEGCTVRTRAEKRERLKVRRFAAQVVGARSFSNFSSSEGIFLIATRNFFHFHASFLSTKSAYPFAMFQEPLTRRQELVLAFLSKCNPLRILPLSRVFSRRRPLFCPSDSLILTNRASRLLKLYCRRNGPREINSN